MGQIARTIILSRVALLVLSLSLSGCVAGEPDDSDPQATSIDISLPTAGATSTSTAIPPIPTQTMPTATTVPTATVARPSPSSTATSEPAALCDPVEIRRLVDSFLAAFNAGDRERLDTLLPDENYPYAPAAPGPLMDQHRFRGFSLDNLEANDREALLDLFAERHAAGEQWELQDIFIGDEYRDPLWQTPQLAGIAIQMARRASDIEARTIVGKGGVNCLDETLLFFWGGDDLGEGVIEHSVLRGPGEGTATPSS